MELAGPDILDDVVHHSTALDKTRDVAANHSLWHWASFSRSSGRVADRFSLGYDHRSPVCAADNNDVGYPAEQLAIVVAAWGDSNRAEHVAAASAALAGITAANGAAADGAATDISAGVGRK